VQTALPASIATPAEDAASTITFDTGGRGGQYIAQLRVASATCRSRHRLKPPVGPTTRKLVVA
jgi:hypothetical protein